MKYTLLVSFLIIYSFAFTQKTEPYYINFYGDEVFKKQATFKRHVKKDKAVYRITDYFLNGNIYRTGAYSDKYLKSKTDSFKSYYLNGNLSRETVYKDNKRYGFDNYYRVSGTIEKHKFYTNGKGTGRWYWFDEQGDTIRNYGNIKRGSKYLYERPAYLKGGRAKWNAYWDSMREVNDLTFDEAQAIVYFCFKIDTMGKVKDIEIILGGTPDMNKTLIDHLRKMPEWFPAIKKGKLVEKTIFRSFRWYNVSTKDVETKDKDLAKAYYLSAIKSFKEKDFILSKDKFKQAVKYNPNNAEYYFNLALCYYQLGDIDTACEYWNIVNILNPDKISKDIKSVCKNKIK